MLLSSLLLLNFLFSSPLLLRGHAKFMGYMGPVQMGYRAMTFSTHINNSRWHFFRKHIYGANTFFIHFYALFYTLDTICADNKDKPMAGCKNQLIKK